MTFFTINDYYEKYNVLLSYEDTWKIEAVSEMIYNQVGLMFRDNTWTSETVPKAIKNASMEQFRFMQEYDIPFIDYKGRVEAGEMKNELKSDYSTLALRMLANAGYLFRGNPLNQNMNMTFPFGD